MIKKRKLGECLEGLAEGIVRFVGIAVFGVLSAAALISSQYMLPGGEELPVNKLDFPFFQIAALAVVSGSMYFLKKIGKRLDDSQKKRWEYILLAGSMLIVLVCGMLWIGSLDRVPEGDQAYVYGAASYFIEGQYSFLEKGGYCQIYPQQLGLIALIELLFRAVGTYQYFAFEVINVLMAAGIVGIGYLLLKELKGTFEAVVYCFAMIGCVPLVCYTSWVYGDICGLFFVMLSMLFLCRLQRTHKWLDGVFSVVMGVLSVLVRRTNLIFFVALFLLSLVYIAGRREMKYFVVIAAMSLGFLLCNCAIEGIYEKRSGNEISQGLPTNSWIAMGMQEYRGVCGWYNNMPKEVGAACDWDFDATEQVMDGIIKERLETFLADPVYGITFYTKKILSQWNEPLYQSVYFSAKYEGDDRPEEGSSLDRLYRTEGGYFQLFELANIWQFIVYFGMLLYFVCVKTWKEQPIKWILAVTIIGGAFFSVLWEAKARYIFPYYVMMFPLMVQGYAALAEKCITSLQILQKRVIIK